MKVHIAMLATETNSFSPLPTGMQSFKDTCLYHGDATKRDAMIFTKPLHLWREYFEREGMSVSEGLATFAQPGGITTKSTYESLRDELLESIESAMPLDGVVLFLHGSMVAQGYDDCEGDLLQRVRNIVGDTCCISVELDLHATLTPLMVECADILVAFKLYPHTDFVDRAQELADLTLKALKGEITPVMCVSEVNMVSLWRTSFEPMAGFVRDMQAAEQSGEALSVSFIHGFPWTDAPHSYAKMLVLGDGDIAAAQALADKFSAKIYSLREQTRPQQLDMREGIARAVAATNTPVVLVDTADNAGAGAASDSTFLLQALLDAQVPNIATGLYWDPVATRICMEAGEGEDLRLRIGGKCGPESGAPIDLQVTVMKIICNAEQPFGSSVSPMGASVWVRASGGVDIVLTTVRCQTFHPEAFAQFGIPVSDKKIICVKSLQHFYAGFSELTDNIVYLNVPGALSMDFESIPFEKMTADYWPRVDIR